MLCVLASTGAYVGGAIAAIVVIAIVAFLLMGKKGGAASESSKVTPSAPPSGETTANNMPSMVAPVKRDEPALNAITKESLQAALAAKAEPPSLPPAPSAAAAPGDGKVVSSSGRVISVPTELSAGEPSHKDLAPLEPSATAEVPSLAEATLEPTLDEIKIGTDELPRMVTQEVARIATAEMVAPPAQATGKARYRTPQAQAMQEAIETMKCPKCGQATFVGREAVEDASLNMVRLEGRCGACGHKAQIIDMRVG
jgi:hypothetical protein